MLNKYAKHYFSPVYPRPACKHRYSCTLIFLLAELETDSEVWAPTGALFKIRVFTFLVIYALGAWFDCSSLLMIP